MLDVFRIVSESREKYTIYWLILDGREHYRDDYDSLRNKFFNASPVEPSDCDMRRSWRGDGSGNNMHSFSFYSACYLYWRPIAAQVKRRNSADYDRIFLTDFVQASGKRASSLVRNSYGDTLPLR